MISRQASTPSMFGIITSMTMICRVPRSEPSLIASTPSAASPTTSKSSFTLQRIPQAAAHDGMVVNHHHPDSVPSYVISVSFLKDYL